MTRSALSLFFSVSVVILAALFGAVGAFWWRATYIDPTLPGALEALVLGEEAPPTPALGSVLPEHSPFVPSEEDVPLEEATRGWLVYRGEEVGVSFRYPQGWFVLQKVSKKPFSASVYLSSAPVEGEEPLIKIVLLGKVDGSLEEWLGGRSSSEVEKLDFGERTWLRPSEDKLLESGYNNLFTVDEKGRAYNFIFEILEDSETDQLVESLFLTLEFI